MTTKNNGTAILLFKGLITLGMGYGMWRVIQYDFKKSIKDDHTIVDGIKKIATETTTGKAVTLIGCVYLASKIVNAGSKEASDMAVKSYQTGGTISQFVQPRLK